MKTLTEQQINIAIAEAVGIQTRGIFWQWFAIGCNLPTSKGHHSREACVYDAAPWFSESELKITSYEADCAIPNFCGDLNAMAQAEATLTDEQWGQYRQHLFTEAAGKDCKDFATRLAPKLPPRFTRGRAYASATALQRATAFVRALNLEPKSK